MALVVDFSIDSCLAVSYKRMEEKGVMPDRTLLLRFRSFFSVASFPTKEWRKRMSFRTGPCCLVSY